MERQPNFGRLARFIIKISNNVPYIVFIIKKWQQKTSYDEQGLMRYMYVPRPMNHILNGS